MQLARGSSMRIGHLPTQPAVYKGAKKTGEALTLRQSIQGVYTFQSCCCHPHKQKHKNSKIPRSLSPNRTYSRLPECVGRRGGLLLPFMVWAPFKVPTTSIAADRTRMGMVCLGGGVRMEEEAVLSQAAPARVGENPPHSISHSTLFCLVGDFKMQNSWAQMEALKARIIFTGIIPLLKWNEELLHTRKMNIISYPMLAKWRKALRGGGRAFCVSVCVSVCVCVRVQLCPAFPGYRLIAQLCS